MFLLNHHWERCVSWVSAHLASRDSLPLSEHSSSCSKQPWKIEWSRGKLHLQSSTVALESNLCYVFCLMDHLQSDKVYLLSQKSFKNGLIFKKFSGSFMFPTVHRHLVLLNVGWSPKKLLLKNISDYISFTSFWFTCPDKSYWPLNSAVPRKGPSPVFLGGDQGGGYLDLLGFYPNHFQAWCTFLSLNSNPGPAWLVHSPSGSPAKEGIEDVNLILTQAMDPFFELTRS